jgi:cell division protein FtsN
MEKKAEKKKKTPPSSSKKGHVLWIGLTLFISAWMFLLGVIVGRGTSPVHFDIERLKKDFAELKKTVQKEKKRFKIDTRASNQIPNLEFYEKLKESEDNVKAHQLLGKGKPEQKPRIIIEKPSVEKTQEPEIIVPQKTVDSENAKFTIQVAAHKDQKFADTMVEQLKKKGYRSYRSRIETSEQEVWYRVRVGYFKNREEPQNILLRLKADGFTDAIIMKY